jgi:hypothetical protein
MSDTSSARHGQSHQYAANHDQFPGHLGHGRTCQQLVVPAQPEVIAQAEVGPAAADGASTRAKTTRSRTTRKRGQK